MKQQTLPESEDMYTLGDPSDTVVIRFRNEDDMWTFLRKYPSNKWTTYSGEQMFFGIDNQIRGGDADKNQAIRTLYRTSIQIMSTRYPDADVSKTHVYRDYQKGIIKTKGDTWVLLAKWHKPY